MNEFVRSEKLIRSGAMGLKFMPSITHYSSIWTHFHWILDEFWVSMWRESSKNEIMWGGHRWSVRGDNTVALLTIVFCIIFKRVETMLQKKMIIKNELRSVDACKMKHYNFHFDANGYFLVPFVTKILHIRFYLDFWVMLSWVMWRQKVT